MCTVIAGVNVEAVHVAIAGIKFAAALSSAPVCCLSSLEEVAGAVGAGSCVFLQFPRRSSWQLEQALFAFLQE